MKKVIFLSLISILSFLFACDVYLKQSVPVPKPQVMIQTDESEVEPHTTIPQKKVYLGKI